MAQWEYTQERIERPLGAEGRNVTPEATREMHRLGVGGWEVCSMQSRTYKREHLWLLTACSLLEVLIGQTSWRLVTRVLILVANSFSWGAGLVPHHDGSDG